MNILKRKIKQFFQINCSSYYYWNSISILLHFDFHPTCKHENHIEPLQIILLLWWFYGRHFITLKFRKFRYQSFIQNLSCVQYDIQH